MSKAASVNMRKQQSATSTSPKNAPVGLLDLIIDRADLPAAAARLADRLSAADTFFQRAEALVKVVESDRGPTARPITVHDVVNHGHRVCRPVLQRIVQGEIVLEPVTLPDRVARLYLNLHDKWTVGQLNGICRAPILSDDGNIRVAQRYDPETGHWCAGIDSPDIPKRPSRLQAEKALHILRSAFATLPFADACMVGRSGSTTAVDLSKSPGIDETSHIYAVLTAVCRPSLPLALASSSARRSSPAQAPGRASSSGPSRASPTTRCRDRSRARVRKANWRNA